MELPKNITQIGQADNNVKIYVEDYVVSYIKQLNHMAQSKALAVALYGVHKEEAGITYLFFYGAAKLDFLQRETRHLSQAQQQEIERLRRNYFAEQDFLGYRILDGEMVEGFHILEQGICRYIAGYAQFYEKNDSMLAYMLDVRKEEIQPEVVDQEKYDVVKKRQEERRQADRGLEERRKEHRSYEDRDAEKYRDYVTGNERNRADNVRQYRKPKETAVLAKIQHMKVSIVASFALLCVFGLALMSKEGGMENLQIAAKQMLEGLGEQKLPDAVEVANHNAQNVQTETLVTEDKLTNALEQENQEVLVATTPEANGTDIIQPAETVEQQLLVQTPQPQVTQETTQPTVEPTPTPDATQPPVVSTQAEPEPVSYTIKSGDTLIGISLNNYGNETMVKDICALNQITNPDDIKVGQKILLP